MHPCCPIAWMRTRNFLLRGIKFITTSSPARKKHLEMIPFCPLRKRVWCGRRELNPHGLAACGFSYHFGFRRPAGRVRGLDYTFTIPHTRFRCCPSSPLHLPGSASGLGSGIAISGFPDFEQFYAVGFPMGTQACLKSAASAISPRPLEIGHSLIIIQAAMTYISAAKRRTSTRPGPFLEMAVFFERGLTMLMAAPSSRRRKMYVWSRL